MRVRVPLVLALLATVSALSIGCQRSIFRQYEYEEEIYLKLDGSATVLVTASIAALAELRGLDLDTSANARVDRVRLRELYESPVTQVTRVSKPWTRNGRRYVHLRMETGDIRQLSSAAPFSWSSYQFDQKRGLYVYRQTFGPSAGKAAPGVTWAGDELVAVRMHVPSRIEYHNATSRQVDRGNIVVWEQPLQERRAGRQLQMEVRMEQQSILYRTLTIFGLAMIAAVMLMAAVIWWVKRKGRETPAAA